MKNNSTVEIWISFSGMQRAAKEEKREKEKKSKCDWVPKMALQVLLFFFCFRISRPNSEHGPLNTPYRHNLLKQKEVPTEREAPERRWSIRHSSESANLSENAKARSHETAGERRGIIYVRIIS